MGLIPKNKKDFGLKVRDENLRAENIVLAKGGSVVVGDHWVRFGDTRIDVPQAVLAQMLISSRRVFNNRGDIMYALVCVDEYGTVVVVPSIAMNRRSFGEIKTFPDLSGKLPLMLVRLRHDGSEDLNAMLPVKAGDIEVYKGYGNFTLSGPRGSTGAEGFTGFQGVTGWIGIIGYGGHTGVQGDTGLPGVAVQGATGSQGSQGYSISAFQSSVATYIQDVTDSTIDSWIDSVDDTDDSVQDTV